MDDVDASVNALNKMLVARKLPPISREFYRANFGFPVRPFYSQIGMNPDQEWDRICVEFHNDLHAEPQHIRPDTTAALEYAQNRGARQSILSALRQDLLLRDTAAEGVQDFFEEIYGVDNLDGATKISRGRELLAKIKDSHAKSFKLFFIGDTLHDAEVALELGATPILIGCGHQCEDRLRTSGHAVAPNLLNAVKAILG